MKKLIHFFFCYIIREVVDIDTKKRERATYYKVLGFVVSVKYEPISKSTKVLGV